MCLELPVHEFLPFFSIRIALSLSWKTFCHLDRNSVAQKNSNIKCSTEDNRSYLLNLPLYYSSYLIFVWRTWYWWLHVQKTWRLLCSFSCQRAPHKKHQPTNIISWVKKVQWVEGHWWSDLHTLVLWLVFPIFNVTFGNPCAQKGYDWL